MKEEKALVLQDSTGKTDGVKFHLSIGILTVYRWHADIKPENVLVVNDKFKLADPGFAVFEDGKQDVDGRPRKEIKGGTTSYGKWCIISRQ